MAHGLASAIGGKVEDLFEIPGYRLRRFAPDGMEMGAKVRLGLEDAGIIKDGGFRAATLDSALQ